MTTDRAERSRLALAPAPLIYGAFILGLATAIAFRVIIILQHAAPPTRRDAAGCRVLNRSLQLLQWGFHLLRSIERSPENLNYLIISVFSVAAIGIDLVMVLF